MQSFTSIGPMLDIAALFSVIAIYSGIYLPVVVLLSFLLSYSTMNTAYRLSNVFITNGGYYSYVGKVLGKRTGVFTGIIYLLYGSLVLPNISLFISNFIVASIDVFMPVQLWMEIIIAIMFSSMIVLFVSRGLKLTIKYIVLTGIMELFFILIMSYLFFVHGVVGFGIYSGRSFDLNGMWLGLLFGILAFAGGSSSIFLSDNVKAPEKTIPRSIFYSYTVSGVVMVISSLSLVFFIGYGGIVSYSINPFFIVNMISKRFGIYVVLIYIFFTVLSASNLCVSYLNALSNVTRKMVSDNFFGTLKSRDKATTTLLSFVLLLSITLELFSYNYLGYFNMFVILAGIVSLSYILIHVITNIALLKVAGKLNSLSSKILSLTSTIILSISFYYSVADITFPLILSDILFGISVISTILVIIYLYWRKTTYNLIEFNVRESLHLSDTDP